MSNAPILSVRAMAEMIDLPAYQTMRVLHDQKFPRREPQLFRVTYYQPVLRAIRAYYSKDNDEGMLHSARELIQAGLPKGSRRRHNLRVLDAFAASEQAKRHLEITRSARARVPVSTDADNEATANTMPIDGAVHLRVAFDLVAIERDANGAPGQTRRIFYNTRVVAMEPEMARVTLELTHWALERAGRPTPMSNLELVDLTADRVYHVTRRRARTIERTRATAAMIEALWPTL